MNQLFVKLASCIIALAFGMPTFAQERPSPNPVPPAAPTPRTTPPAAVPIPSTTPPAAPLPVPSPSTPGGDLKRSDQERGQDNHRDMGRRHKSKEEHERMKAERKA